jgi:HAD superfamily hydrolase (TIGR01490 family)
MSPVYNSIALFDLDHTLLPVDSDHEWGRFLVRLGVVDGAYYEQENERFYNDYKAGKLDIYGFLQFALKPLASHSKHTLDQWHRQFMQEVIEPQIRPEALSLVKKHQDLGDLCCVVTATNSFVTKPIAERFGISHLIATEPEITSPHQPIAFTGNVSGEPNFREGKVTHVEAWLTLHQLSWDTLQKSCFYSDSMNDLPLLDKVQTPIATNPDARLRQLAVDRNWQILELFNQ